MSRAALKTRAISLSGVDLLRLVAGADDSAVDAAVQRYSQDNPRLKLVQMALVDGGADLPAEFEDGFSAVLSVECPVGIRPPHMLKGESFYVYAGAAGPRVELLDITGSAAVVAYSLRHVAADVAVDASADAQAAAYTLPAQHAEAVASWAAAVLCEMEASRTSNKTTPTIHADTTDQSKPAQNFANRAKNLRQRYFDELGIDPKKCEAAGFDVTFNSKDSRGNKRLTHPLPIINNWY